jgi:GNAT superfamily N-acetyltransferase
MVLEIAAHEDSLGDVVADADDWRRMLARPDVRVLLAVEGEDFLGYASTTRRLSLWMGGDLLALDDLYVRESARNRGAGRRLLMEIARLAAPERLTVVWGARLDNHDGHRFYRRIGAHLNTKVVAAWSPDAYDWAVSPGR